MLPYLVRARWTAFTFLVACSFDGSGLVSAGPPGSTSGSTGDTSTSTAAPTTGPTSVGPDGSGGASESESAGTSTTMPVDPSSTSTSTSTSTSEPLTTEPDTTEPGTTTTTTGPDTTTSSTTEPDTTSTGPDTTTGPMCENTGDEPNETEGESVDLGEQHCKANAKSFQGVLDGDGDLDWFRYHGDFSGAGCGGVSPDPTAKIVVSASEPLEVCLFADCDTDGDTSFTCPGGTTPTDSPDGRKGCCGTGSMEYAVNCSDSDESAMMYVRLQTIAPDACIEYKVDYSYHN